MTSMTIEEALEWGQASLSRIFERPEIEIQAILSRLKNLSRTDLLLKRLESLSPDQTSLFKMLVQKRRQREPVAYLFGKSEFMGFEFSVSPAVLIPRPETEILVEEALRYLKGKRGARVLEIGAGSGCISVSMALLNPSLSIVSTDVAKAALEVAKTNAERHKVGSKVEFLLSDLYGGLAPELERDFDMIISNPPYVSTAEMTRLEADLAYEPELALNGGKNGLDIIRPLIEEASLYLKKDGTLILEIGSGQGGDVARLLEKNGFKYVRLKKDFSGHDRIIKGTI